jgi:putative ABC transport system permease protein
MKKTYLKVWRDVVAQKWQFVALTLIILLGVTSYGGMMGMLDDVLQSIEHTLDELRMADFAVSFQDSAPASVVQAVAALDNVQAVNGRWVVDTGLAISDDKQANVRLIGMPTSGQPPVDQIYVTQGRYLQDGDGLAAVLDHHLTDYYGYGPGDILHPIVNGERLDVKVVGVGVSPEYLMAVPSSENPLPSPSGFGVLFMPEQELQRLFHAEGEINDLTVVLRDRGPGEVDAAVDKVKAAVGDSMVRSVVKRANNPSYNLLKLDLEGGKEMMGAIPAMLLLVAALSIYVSLTRMVQTQRPQIGVLKTLGYGKWTIMGHYLLFSGLVAVVGSVLGLALSYPMGLAFSHAYAAQYGLPFVVARFHLGAAAEAIGITLLFCLAAGAFPAWRSARITPAQAIRFDPAVALVKGSVPLMERALGAVLPLSTVTKVALRDLFRNRRRTLTTALGFVFALMVVLASWAMFDALGYMLNIQFQQTDRWDLHAFFSQPQSDSLASQVSGWSGVAAVEPVIEMPVTFKSISASENSFLTAIAPDTALHHFRLPRGETPDEALAPGQVLLSPHLGDGLGVKTGDEITLQTPLGAWKVRVDTSNDEVMTSGGYVSLNWLREQMGAPQVFNALLLRVDSGQRAKVRKQLYTLPGIAGVDLKQEILAGWKALMGLYYVLMGTFLLFALIIAGAVIFNTMTVNVLERQREIATMRALGQSRRRLTGMITLENALVGLVSLVPGLAAGSLATYYLFQVFSSSGDFYLPFHIYPQTYLFVTALTFITALLSQMPAVRRVNRMDLAEATKVMT